MLQKFTGKERDSESGLNYFGARYYGSALGRFTSPDWSASPESVPYADLSNPQSFNQYAYVRNNPVSARDSDGDDCTAAGVCTESMMKEIANIIQIKISTGVGVSAGTEGGGAYGAKAEANLIKVEAKGGLGGGNLDAKVESGVKISGNAGPLNASGKVAVEMSAVNGASGGLSGEAGAGGVGVKVDFGGVHAQIATEQKDEIIGGEIHVGVGIGAGLNVTQAKGVFNNFLQNVGNVTAFASDSLKSVFSGVSGQTQPNIIPSLSPNQ